MESKNFKCKHEEVPVIAGFAATSLRRDMSAFSDYSSLFSESYAAELDSRSKTCYEMIKSGAITSQIKQVTQQMSDKVQSLRLSLNKTEGYLDLAKGSLDIAVEDFGLKAIRACINVGDTEGVIMKGHNLVTVLTRNQAALLAKGMKADFVTSLTTLIDEIATLNKDQNSKLSERNQTTNDNIKEFNDLWEMVATVLKTGKLLYRGVDDVKLKDYTLDQLLKRINAEGGSSAAGGATTVGNN